MSSVLPVAPFLAEDSALAIVRAYPDPIMVLDANGDVVFANEAAQTLAPMLRPGRSLTLAMRYPALTEAVKLTLADGLPRKVEILDPVPVERAFLAEVNHSPNDEARVIITLRDVTAQRRTERLRVDFIANVSHELRTPLASLMGFIETLLGPARDDLAARERFLGIMMAQGKRMTRLIDDLLSLSRIEMNEHVPPKEKIDLAALMDDLCDTLTPVMNERNITLTIKRSANQIPVRGDRDELIRLFENLIQNAAKYGADGERVDVSMTIEGKSAIIAVRDYGAGIPPEHLPRLTERFYRADVAQSRSKGGTGLGLAIVKHITNRHRGHLSIASQLGAGACFTIRLPLYN